MRLFKSKSIALLTVAALFSIVCSPALIAQTAETGAIAGKLSGVNGTVIAAAAVTSVHNSTDQLRSETTDKNGAYEFTLLPPGTYTVRFAAPGYATTEVRAVKVNAGDAVTISQALNPGSNSEVTVIQWVAPAVPGTASAADTQEIAVKSIPLASRNYTQAAGMSAGVSSQVSNATAIGINTQGVQVGSGSTNNYVMDGAPVASNTQGPVSPGIPNPDAIQDNNVQSWTYDAGTGRYAGANISVVTKSGSNSFHGTLFEFVRNDIFNSNDYFLKQKGFPEPVLKQNQFGFTFGGPIRKDKFFIFGSYQGTRQRNGFSAAGFAQGVILPPLPATRTLETVGAANCPASHPGDTRYQTIQGGVQVACDGSNINPVALNILNLKLANGAYYLPGSSTGDFQSTPYSFPAKFQEDQFLVNTDYVITAKHTLAERFFYSHDPQFSNFTGGQGGQGSSSSLPGAPSNIVTGNISGVVKLTSALTANLSNEMRISGQHYLLTDTPLVPFTNGDVGIASVVPQFNTLDILNIAGLINLGGNGTWDHNSVNQYQAADQVSWVHGRQTFRLGFDADRRQWNITILGDAIGELNVGSFADFLLGLPGCPPSSTTCSIANPGATNGSAFSNINTSTGPAGFAATVTGPDGINHAYRFSDYAGYLQDDFKAASRLTLNLGLRWDYFSLPSDDTGNITTFWTSLVTAGAAVPAENTYPGYVVPSNFKGTLPEGVTRNSRRTPIPIGAPVTDFAPRVGFAWQPLANSSLAVRGGYGIYFDRPDAGMLSGFANAAVPYATPVGGSGAANYQASLAQPYLPTALGWGPSRTVDFANQSSSNLTLRMLDENFSALLTQKWNLEIQQQLPANLILALGYAGAHSVHMQNSDRELNGALLASPSNPVNGITTNTVANAALRVPYLGIAANGLDSQQTQASAKYNSLQATLRKQISHGVQMQAAYTFSKTLSTTSAGMGPSMDSNDPLDARQQYGPSPMAAPQRLAVNYSWDLPYKGAGTRGKLLGDWSLSGMTIIQSGTPMTLGDPRGGSIYGDAGTSRAQFCPGMGAADAATKGSVKDRLNAFFNPLAFNSSCLPPMIGDGYGYGNSSVGFILGPGQDNTDLSVHKSIAIKESKMELRVELFNAFNHPQFMGPDTNVPDPGFGKIISTSVNPRLIQFALKYSF